MSGKWLKHFGSLCYPDGIHSCNPDDACVFLLSILLFEVMIAYGTATF